MSGLPEGWVECQIGDVASVVGGGTPDSRDPENFSLTEGIAWLTPADLSKHNGTYITRGKRFLTEKGFNASSAKLLPRGTVLFSSRAPIGYVAIAANEISTNQGFKSFLCRDGISSEYIYYWLKFAKPLAEELASGTTFAEISGKNAARIPLRLAPLNEQRRIVAKLQKLLSRVDAAQVRLATIPHILKRFRQSVLTAACSGQLTADWRKENAINQGEWEKAKLMDLLLEPLSNGRSVVDATEGCPVLRLTCLRNGRIDLSERKIGAWTFDSARRFFVAKGDFFVSRGNGSLSHVGRGGLVEDEPDAVAFPDTLIRLRTRNDLINQRFLREVWRSRIIREQIESSAHTTAGIWKISQKDIGRFILPLPELAEQEEIVRRVEALFKTADELEARYLKAKAHVDMLTQSILAKAFRGELVPQDPSDEPASLLLERIRTREVHSNKCTVRRAKPNAMTEERQ
jgi:type I restriction enzyme S subunit